MGVLGRRRATASLQNSFSVHLLHYLQRKPPTAQHIIHLHAHKAPH